MSDVPRVPALRHQVVPGGQAGIDAIAAAWHEAREQGTAWALLPDYAPVQVRRRLEEAMRPPVSGPAVPLAGALVCPTSGSTQRPRAVVQPVATLEQAAADRDQVLGGPAAWLVAVAPVSAAAVIAVIRANRGPLPARAWRGSGGRFGVDEFVADARALQQQARAEGVPVRVTMVGAQLGALLESAAGASVLAGFDTVLVGGGPVPSSMRNRALHLGIRVCATYGLTETCGGCVYDGLAVPGTDIRIESGQVLVRGRSLAAGYVHSAFDLQDGWLPTGDRGVIESGVLHVRGRFDRVVAVKGTNVDLDAVESVIADLPGVRECTVLPGLGADGGFVVQAHLVGELDEREIRDAVAAQLGPAARPTIVRHDSLPRTQSGKVDTELLRTVALRAGPS